MDGISAKRLRLFDGLAEGNSPLFLKLTEDTAYKAVLEVGEILESLTTVKEPLLSEEFLPCEHISLLLIVDDRIPFIYPLSLGTGDNGMDLHLLIGPQLVIGYTLYLALCLGIDLYILCRPDIVKL